MIGRTWHGRVPAAKADAYHEYLLRTGVPGYKSTPGNRGVYVLRRVEGDVAHFLLLSLWDSYEAIRAFAGEEIERAHYYPEDTEFLLELEPTVTHYEVLGGEDPLFTDVPVSKGLGPTDLSERHDEYLYGDDEGS
jgi:heme-degrading monooxygenase HmoA